MQGASFYNPANLSVSPPSVPFYPKPEHRRAAIPASLIDSVVQRIKILMAQNHRLIFWFSTSMLFAAAPGVFIASAAVALFVATHNHFGLGEKLVRHICLETTSGLNGVLFACGLIFRQFQPFFGGFTLGLYLHSLWSGQVHGKDVRGLGALGEEMARLDGEFARGVRSFVLYGSDGPVATSTATL